MTIANRKCIAATASLILFAGMHEVEAIDLQLTCEPISAIGCNAQEICIGDRLTGPPTPFDFSSETFSFGRTNGSIVRWSSIPDTGQRIATLDNGYEAVFSDGNQALSIRRSEFGISQTQFRCAHRD